MKYIMLDRPLTSIRLPKWFYANDTRRHKERRNRGHKRSELHRDPRAVSTWLTCRQARATFDIFFGDGCAIGWGEWSDKFALCSPDCRCLSEELKKGKNKKIQKANPQNRRKIKTT